MTISDETGVAAQIPVTLSAASSRTVTVSYATADGTATATNDYITASDTLTFAAGDTTAYIPVTIVQDDIDELDETFTVTISGGVNATIATASGTMTITDDDDTPTVSVVGANITETTGNLTVTVNLNRASSQTITVDYATSDDTATAGADYTATNNTLTFDPGDVSKTFLVGILADTTDEYDEAFTVTLTSPTNADLGTAVGTMLINDDDAAPTIDIADNSTTNEANGTTNLVATLSAASEKTITVEYDTSDGTAEAGSDYTAGSGTITFTPNDTSENVPVAVIQDTTDEENETVTVTLSNPSEVTLSDAVGVLTITDDDNEPSLSIADVTAPDETNVARTLTVTLSSASAKSVTVDYATSDGTATEVSDYVAASDTLTFAPGETTKTVPITVVQDDLNELDETVTVTLSNETNATIASAVGTLTITDDEERPTLSIASVTSSDEQATDLVATVTLSGQSSQTITVDYASSNGSATATSDYTAVSDTLTFDPGDLTKTILIPILHDTVDEIDETFDISLSTPVNANISTTNGSATMTITDDDDAPTVSIADDSTSDEAAGPTNLTVTLSAASEKTITVQYATSDGTATASSDYTASTGTLTFNPSETTKNVAIAVLADITDEENETVTVTLSNPSEVSLNDAVGELTITDDDDPPTLSVDNVTTPDESAVIRSFTVTLSEASAKTVTVNYATADGTASAANDYISTSGPLTFNPGITSQTVDVTIVQDTIDEAHETFTLALSGEANATIASATGTMTITDDETTPTLSILDASTSDETAANLTITVTLSGQSSETVTVDYATADGTATTARLQIIQLQTIH